MESTAITTDIINPIIVPLLQDLAFNGYVSCHIKYNINPKMGIKAHSTEKPILGASSDAATFPLAVCATPHFGHTTALLSISAPQFLQKIYSSFCICLKVQVTCTFNTNIYGSCIVVM